MALVISKSLFLSAGVIARDPAFFPYLKEALTVEVVREYFGHLLEEDSVVER